MSQLSHMALELLKIEEDLPFRMNYFGETPTIDGFYLYTFMQTWGSTALGFEGVGGCAMTEARTYVFVPKEEASDQLCHVYFGERFAYSVPYSTTVMDDVMIENMEPVSSKNRYIKQTED